MTQEPFVEAQVIADAKLLVDPAQVATGITCLRAADPKIARLIEHFGTLTMTREPDLYVSLVRAIVAQQISTKAEQAIYRRLLSLFAPDVAPSAAKMRDLTDEKLREVGLSRQKAAYMRDLSSRVVDGRLDLAMLPQMDDEEIITALVAVKGIGRWTAEMMLIFALGRMDVWPVDDLGIVVAVQHLLGLEARPKPKDMRVYGEIWRPYRSLASLYLWQSAAAPSEFINAMFAAG